MRQPDASSGDRGEAACDPKGYEGYEVRDLLGRRVGRAEKLFLNGDGAPTFVEVRLGLFGKSALIPAQGVSVDAERRTLVLGKATIR